jgi:hypothetical protein
LLDSKDLDNMIDLYPNNNVDLKTICIPFRIKKEKFQFIRSYLNHIINQPKGKITFHVFDPNYNATYYYICEWTYNGLNIIKKDFIIHIHGWIHSII